MSAVNKNELLKCFHKIGAAYALKKLYYNKYMDIACVCVCE